MHQFRKLRLIWLAACIAACIIFVGCNTMRGMGKDVERAGQKIQQKAN